MRDISEEKRMSVVVVSHQDIADGFAHSEYLMKDGILERITSTGTKAPSVMEGIKDGA